MTLNRNIQPPLTIPSKINVPMSEVCYSQQGVALHKVSVKDHNVLRLSIVFNAGVKYQHSPFVASSTLNMMSEGTQKYTAEELAEIQDFYGLNYEATMDRDYAIVSV
ncbi:MAG: hypothetical protein J6R62_02280 [Rikenellaceae bacterium]|nr:hypothetical protein [Rikenellaceae bacterium]